MTNDAKPPERESFELFLADDPPGSTAAVEGAFTVKPSAGLSGPQEWMLDLRRFKLHCPVCDGERTFDPNPRSHAFGPQARDRQLFLTYLCSDCRRASKLYAVVVRSVGAGDGAVFAKIGERPPFGPPLPSRLLTLLRESSDFLSAGRRCENQSMGIGAFVYYRRVVEDQRGRLFDEMIRAAQTLGGYDELVADLEAAKKATRFKESIESIKHGLPEALLVKGQNPLTLLHGALSDGVHNLSDKECLARATAVRRVLTAFAERLEATISDDDTLLQAVQALQAAGADSKGRQGA